MQYEHTAHHFLILIRSVVIKQGKNIQTINSEIHTWLKQSVEQMDLALKLSTLGGMNMEGRDAKPIPSIPASSLGGVVV